MLSLSCTAQHSVLGSQLAGCHNRRTKVLVYKKSMMARKKPSKATVLVVGGKVSGTAILMAYLYLSPPAQSRFFPVALL